MTINGDEGGNDIDGDGGNGSLDVAGNQSDSP